MRLRGLWDEPEARIGHSPDSLLRDWQVARVDEIVGRIDPRERRSDALELRPWIVVPRRIELVDQVVGVELPDPGLGPLLGISARRLPRWILRLIIERRRSGDEQQRLRGAKALDGLLIIFASRFPLAPRRIRFDAVDRQLAPHAVEAGDLDRLAR